MPRSFMNTVRNYRSRDSAGGTQAQFSFNCMVTRSGRSFNTHPQRSRSFSGATASRSTSRHRRSGDYRQFPTLYSSGSPPSWVYLPIMTRYHLILRHTKIDFSTDPHVTKTIGDHDFDSARDFLHRRTRYPLGFTLIHTVFLPNDFTSTKTYKQYSMKFPVKLPEIHATEIRLKLKLEPDQNKRPLAEANSTEISVVKKPRTDSPRLVLVQAKPDMTRRVMVPFYEDHTLKPAGKKHGAYTCIQCDRIFVNYAAARSHALAHSLRTNRCHICGKVFSRNWLLQGHMRIHSGEKPYRCDQCLKAFADKSNLRSHLLIHSTKSREFVCSVCQRAFAQKRYLNKHQQEVCGKTELQQVNGEQQQICSNMEQQ